VKPADQATTTARSGPAGRGHRPAGDPVFSHAVTEILVGLATQRQLRPELKVETEEPPRRLAPLAYAAAATAYASPPPLPGAGGRAAAADADTEIGWGRFVLLFDAAGQPGWDGKYRIIGYVRAELEPEMAADPLIREVGWSWLTEALDGRTTGYRNISGTVTTVVTQGFGGKRDEPTATDFELRASWSPVLSDDVSPGLDGHVAAWCDMVCAAAGLPPLAPGISALRPPRRRPRP
jgi:Protein of unknown function (DUF3000)